MLPTILPGERTNPWYRYIIPGPDNQMLLPWFQWSSEPEKKFNVHLNGSFYESINEILAVKLFKLSVFHDDYDKQLKTNSTTINALSPTIYLIILPTPTIHFFVNKLREFGVKSW